MTDTRRTDAAFVEQMAQKAERALEPCQVPGCDVDHGPHVSGAELQRLAALARQGIAPSAAEQATPRKYFERIWFYFYEKDFREKAKFMQAFPRGIDPVLEALDESAALRALVDELLETLQDAVNQACGVGDEIDSMALSAYRDALVVLEKHGLFTIERRVGRRVVGRWNTEALQALAQRRAALLI